MTHPPPGSAARRADVFLGGISELVINDRKFLANYQWKYLIIDESHRIKNLNCKLIKELMSYKSANRLLLTGTPLQNNLEELWSLLNFLMPEVSSCRSHTRWHGADAPVAALPCPATDLRRS